MFDLKSYLKRIGVAKTGNADTATLAIVQFAHRTSIPFENVDVRLGRPVRIDGDGVFDRLVTGGRGGYCFQQNRLFLDALVSLGFDVRPLLARVWLGATETPPLTHSLLLVDFEGARWIADAGFGGSFAPPMPLVDGARTEDWDGAYFRLTRQPDDWRLDRVVPGGNGAAEEAEVQTQYSFDLRQVFPADLELANHWTSTAPGSIFWDRQFVNIVRPDGFASMLDRHYTERSGGGKHEEVIADAGSYRARLRDVFGLDLDACEVDALNLF